ncbi:hypothetical protein [Clostridium botulinum]|nr:hypothetical protein [Clostridium botulinum]
MMNNENQPKTYIEVTNNGGYFARFVITYIINGQPVQEDSGIFAVGMTRRLYIAEGTPYVNLQIRVWIFGDLHILYDNRIQTLTSNCFSVYGTIYNPSLYKRPCVDSPIMPPSSLCCNCCPNLCYNCCPGLCCKCCSNYYGC